MKAIISIFYTLRALFMALGGSDGKESACNAGDLGLIPGSGRFLGEGNVPTPVFLLGEFHGHRRLVGYSPWSHKQSDTTDWLTLWLSLQRIINTFSWVQCSRSVGSKSLQPHESQHTKPPCPSPTPAVHSNSGASSRWCHPAISSSVVPFSSCPNPSQHQGLFQEVNFVWPKYWSFSLSISPSNEYPGLVSFRMDWLDLLAVQGTCKSLFQHHSSKASILQHSAFFTVQLSYPYMTTFYHRA